ncbi:hypothetical protein P4607_29145 [Priestia megaterium]|uniref:tetratricopeptide repeat protein n=1 Tax=Priestia megaterium TaxID=1404 RepID=UPI002E200DCF|nr:hypothetical protein [Priestia megaterium]
MSQYLASVSSGQGFKIFKDIKISGIEEMESDPDFLHLNDFSVLEIIPEQPNQPKFESDFWVEFTEDELNRILTVKILPSNNQQVKDYYIESQYYSNSKINFNIKCSPTVDVDKHLYLIKILDRIKNKDYRRFYLLNHANRRIMSAFCPNLNHTYTKREIYFLELLSKLNEKYDIKFPVPLEISQLMITKAINLLNSWEKSGELERQKNIKLFNKELVNRRTTFISTGLLLNGEEETSNRSLIIHKSGWLNYRSLGISPKSPKYNNQIKNIIAKQESILITLNISDYTPKELLEFISNSVKKENHDFFNVIFKLLEEKESYIEKDVKSSISIHLHEPKNEIQFVDVKIEEVNPNLNRLLQLYREENYVEMVPFLEEFNRDRETLAYAYVLNADYGKAIKLAEECISEDIGSVAHMTRGLAYFALKDYKKAKEAYELGVNVCVHKWFPKAKDNLENFIKTRKISSNNEVRDILNVLSNERKPMNFKQKCYCGSQKSLKRCHAKLHRSSI